MRLYITDISDVTEDMFNTGKMLVPEYRQEKIDRYQYMEDKRRSLVAGLLLNYATKDYEAGNYIAHNYITGNCVDKNYLIEASKRERENIQAGHLWESNSEYDIDINKLISGYDKAYDMISNLLRIISRSMRIRIYILIFPTQEIMLYAPYQKMQLVWI